MHCKPAKQMHLPSHDSMHICCECMKNKTILASFMVLLSAACFPACSSTCSIQEIKQVNTSTQVQGQRISLSWAGKGLDAYRLQVVANLPEGGVLWSLDTQIFDVSYSFYIPTMHAVVKAQVSQGCDELNANDLQSVKPLLYINSRPSCFLSPDDWQYENRIFKFKPDSHISSYSFSLFEMSSKTGSQQQAKLINQMDIKKPFLLFQENMVAVDIPVKFNLKIRLDDPKYLISVTPQCAAYQGIPIAIVLD